MPAKGERYYKGYYWLGDMAEKELEMVNTVYSQPRIDVFKTILNGTTLHDFQTLGPAAAYINKKFFLGDGPGLGKTVQSAAYLKFLKMKKEMKKFIFCTTTDAVFQIKGEIEAFTGLRILPLVGDAQKIFWMLSNYDWRQFDGIIIQHSGLISNELGKFLSHTLGEYDVFILDESSVVKNKTTKSYERAKIISSRMNRVLYLNGTAFETHLFDFYYQFDALNERILPAVSNIKKEFCEIGGGYWKTEMVPTPNGFKRKPVFQKAFDVVGYKNQELFRDKVKFHYLAREKKNVYNQIPDVVYMLETIGRSKAQVDRYNSTSYDELLNSPSTGHYDFEFNKTNVPKLARTLELVQEITGVNKEVGELQGTGEQVVVYCWFRDAQYKIKEELEKLGIPTCVINGETSMDAGMTEDGEMLDSERETLRRAFNAGKYKVVVTNIKRALNLPAANYMILYTIESNPQAMYQIMKRIDRNNMTDKKMYYFLVYSESHEITKLQSVLTDRELQANLFTGTTNDVFRILNEQLLSIMAGENLSSDSTSATGYVTSAVTATVTTEKQEIEYKNSVGVENSASEFNSSRSKKARNSRKNLYDQSENSPMPRFEVTLIGREGEEFVIWVSAPSAEQAQVQASDDWPNYSVAKVG